MGIAAYAVLAPAAGFLAGLVLATVFLGAARAQRRPSWRKTAGMTDHPRFWQMLLWQGGQAMAVLDGAGEALFLCGRAAHYLAACRTRVEPALANLTRDGIGFEQQYANQIFTIFHRLHGRSDYTGTGIGLALCKKIVDRHHGRISALSRPGEGAEFRVVLPLN